MQNITISIKKDLAKLVSVLSKKLERNSNASFSLFSVRSKKKGAKAKEKYIW
jgi:hypothetical protein